MLLGESYKGVRRAGIEVVSGLILPQPDPQAAIKLKRSPCP